MTGRVQRRPLPVIARRSCAVAIQSFSVRRPKEAVFDQCFGHLFLFRSPCDEAIQACSWPCWIRCTRNNVGGAEGAPPHHESFPCRSLRNPSNVRILLTIAAAVLP